MTNLIEYEDASIEVRRVYDDIRATRQTEYINNFWKALDDTLVFILSAPLREIKICGSFT
jgi:hypothetical protein